MQIHRYTYKMTIFLSARADKSICGTDKLCLDAKHDWDLSRYAFARNIALLGAK